MTVVIGTDEAGYGPSLGPLVVAASAWRVVAAEADPEGCLTAALAAAADAEPGTRWVDSKRVHRGPDGFAALERGLLAAVTLAAGRLPRSWPELAAICACEAAGPPEAGRLDATTLPVAADPLACTDAARRIGAILAAGGVTLLALRCRVIQPAEFNRLLDAGQNKADILSAATLDLAAELVAGRTEEPALVWCDRHGGRRRYAPLLTDHFAVPLVRVVSETATASVYDLPAATCRAEFAVGGEARGPVAVASVAAKYVRELAMLAFNTHWSGLDPAVRPTAGYPVDAARWRRQAEAAVTAAGTPWDVVWRRA